LGMSFFATFKPYVYELLEHSIPFIKSSGMAISFLRFVLAIAAIMFAVFACHAWLPAGKRKLYDILPGILFTLLLWIVGGKIFTG
jgi:membrane protein